MAENHFANGDNGDNAHNETEVFASVRERIEALNGEGGTKHRRSMSDSMDAGSLFTSYTYAQEGASATFVDPSQPLPIPAAVSAPSSPSGAASHDRAFGSATHPERFEADSDIDSDVGSRTGIWVPAAGTEEEDSVRPHSLRSLDSSAAVVVAENAGEPKLANDGARAQAAIPFGFPDLAQATHEEHETVISDEDDDRSTDEYDDRSSDDEDDDHSSYSSYSSGSSGSSGSSSEGSYDSGSLSTLEEPPFQDEPALVEPEPYRRLHSAPPSAGYRNAPAPRDEFDRLGLEWGAHQRGSDPTGSDEVEGLFKDQDSSSTKSNRRRWLFCVIIVCCCLMLAAMITAVVLVFVDINRDRARNRMEDPSQSAPVAAPAIAPIAAPVYAPIEEAPLDAPVAAPITAPVAVNSTAPSAMPSTRPSAPLSTPPSALPSALPSMSPTTMPTLAPSVSASSVVPLSTREDVSIARDGTVTNSSTLQVGDGVVSLLSFDRLTTPDTSVQRNNVFNATTPVPVAFTLVLERIDNDVPLTTLTVYAFASEDMAKSYATDPVHDPAAAAAMGFQSTTFGISPSSTTMSVDVTGLVKHFQDGGTSVAAEDPATASPTEAPRTSISFTNNGTVVVVSKDPGPGNDGEDDSGGIGHTRLRRRKLPVTTIASNATSAPDATSTASTNLATTALQFAGEISFLIVNNDNDGIVLFRSREFASGSFEPRLDVTYGILAAPTQSPFGFTIDTTQSPVAPPPTGQQNDEPKPPTPQPSLAPYGFSFNDHFSMNQPSIAPIAATLAPTAASQKSKKPTEAPFGFSVNTGGSSIEAPPQNAEIVAPSPQPNGS